MDTLVMIHCH